MLEEIVEYYGSFGDALITEFHYDSGYPIQGQEEPKADLEIFISCFRLEGGKNDKIIITCEDVQYFKTNGTDRMVDEALILDEGGIITLDFFPEIISGDQLREDPNSDFIVKCKKVSFVLMKNASS